MKSLHFYNEVFVKSDLNNKDFFLCYLHLKASFIILSIVLHNVSLHRKFHQNRSINDCARLNLAKIPESRQPNITPSRSFCDIHVEELMF